MNRRPLPFSAAVLVGVVGPFAFAVVHLVNAVTLESRLLDMDRENNLPTWFSSSLFLLAAVACLGAAGQAERRTGRLGWLVVALLSFAFSVDEVASVHEEAGRRLGAETTLSVAQPLAAVTVLVLLLVVAHAVGAPARRPLRLAGGVLLASQVTATVAGLLVDGTGRFLLETAEDTTEMLTATALLAAALVGAGVRLDLRPSSVGHELRSWAAARDAEPAEPVHAWRS
ncbi:hypothetical protein [Cellulomonas carbonis]|uniref:DUF998 domain-containing protein n=1 Tax=Cellulomonas carbonis T26 TaxID=947969 RepID=A0A0A0BV30_9CELL|nr:hypothetical protein [Cellulomonas carbonis]KGM11751.1 hypothetical protein N868_07530 [Cellulomonas carbonis T26]GGB94531.1 hypothetical protein GCM10010972_04010 [Cellulomonas carbonis]